MLNAPKLHKGDKIMIVAPSRGLKLIGEDCRKIAEKRLAEWGLEVVFAPNTTDENFDMAASASVEKRVADLMTAFSDKSVKGVFTVIGGYNSNQLLKSIDFNVIKNNPKVFIGFSDITALHAAIYAKTGMVTYYGPHYSSLGMLKGCEYTLTNARNMLFESGKTELKPSDEWSDDTWFINQEQREFIKNDGWWQIHEGNAAGTVIGGNLCTFNLNLGTEYCPHFAKDTLLFIEDDAESSPVIFERNLQALINQPDFENVKGVVIGRFQKDSKMSREMLEFIINSKPELNNLPVIANTDMGHTTPIATIPLGGKAVIENGHIFIEA